MEEIKVVWMNCSSRSGIFWCFFTHIYTYFFNKKEYNEPLINSMDYSVLFFSYFEHYLVFSSHASKKYLFHTICAKQLQNKITKKANKTTRVFHAL